MTQQIIGIGDAPADGTGDPLRVSFDKINQNFTELYDVINAPPPPDGPVLTVAGKSGQVVLGVSDILGAASTGYVDNRVEEQINVALHRLVGAAPETLDTIQELADAIATNPDFYSDITAQLSTKLSTTGGFMSGHLTLAADPTLPMHAATKQYIDAWVDTITGMAVGSAANFTDLINAKESIVNVAAMNAAQTTALNTAVANIDVSLSTKANLTDLDVLSAAIDTKADQTYVTTALTSLNNAIVAINNLDLDQVTMTQLLTLLVGKANTSDVYTKSEIDQLLINIKNDYGFIGGISYGGVNDPVTDIIDYGSV